MKDNNKKEEEKIRKEKLKFLELVGDLILLIDGYVIFRLKNYETINYRIKNMDVENKLRINWKITYEVLKKISDIPNSIPGVSRLKRIQIITSLFGTVQFGIIILGYFLAQGGHLSGGGPILFASLLIAACVPLIGVVVARQIALKVQNYYYAHPKKYRFKISNLKSDVQILIDLLRDELKNEDEKTKSNYGIIKMANSDYMGIKVLKSPGKLRKLYWVKIIM